MSKGEIRERLVWWHKSKGELRWWFYFGRHCFHIQLARPRFSMSFGVSTSGDHIFRGDLFGFFWHIDSWPLTKLIDKLRGNPKSWPPYDHSFRFYWYEGGLWLSPWGSEYESSHDDPGWKKMYHLNFPDLLLGKTKYSNLELETFDNVLIPMTDRNYLAKLTFERSTWKRPRWFARVREFTRIELDRDAPKFPGKGENSWDQGDDSIWQMSVEGHSLPKAIAGYIQRVLEYRQKRDGLRSLLMKPEVIE